MENILPDCDATGQPMRAVMGSLRSGGSMAYPPRDGGTMLRRSVRPDAPASPRVGGRVGGRHARPHVCRVTR